MSNFNLAIQMQATVEYTIYSIEGEPVLTIAPATEANKSYFNALLRRSRKNLPRVKSGSIDVDLVKANRNDDRELYAKHVIRGWDDKVVDIEGKPVPFSAAEALSYLQAFPDFIFDELREFAAEPRNFVKTELPIVEDLAKN